MMLDPDPFDFENLHPLESLRLASAVMSKPVRVMPTNIFYFGQSNLFGLTRHRQRERNRAILYAKRRARGYRRP